MHLAAAILVAMAVVQPGTTTAHEPATMIEMDEHLAQRLEGTWTHDVELTKRLSVWADDEGLVPTAFKLPIVFKVDAGARAKLTAELKEFVKNAICVGYYGNGQDSTPFLVVADKGKSYLLFSQLIAGKETGIGFELHLIRALHTKDDLMFLSTTHDALVVLKRAESTEKLEKSQVELPEANRGE